MYPEGGKELVLQKDGDVGRCESHVRLLRNGGGIIWVIKK